MDTSDLSHHILSRYNAELEGVRAGGLQMGGLVEQQFENGVKALYNGDSRLGEEVARLDHKVNAMEVSIDEDCSRILATRNPTASDLRLIVAVIKTITDLGSNAFFVRRDLVGDRFPCAGEVEKLYQPPRYFLTSGLFHHITGTDKVSVRLDSICD